MRTILLSVALVTLGLAVGCGQAAVVKPVQTNQVNLPPSYEFDPAAVQVVAGTVVTWTNNDHFTHSVKVENGPDHVIRPGENVSIAFDTPGEYRYICTFHSQDMQGTVLVTAS